MELAVGMTPGGWIALLKVSSYQDTLYHEREGDAAGKALKVNSSVFYFRVINIIAK